ncbi:MAG: lamin tail domain-containing protein [Bacteroidetes bacterium]|nr:lamin tail domain-containing protein [Bacteroidota bacterium]
MKSTITFGKTILALLFICLFGVNASQGQVVISQFYGNGGNTGATYNADFVELYNKGNTAVNFGGTWSIQYASATGPTWTNSLTLTGTIPANGYYLIRLGTGANGVALPITPDQTGTIAMSGSAGKFALCNSTTALSGTCPTGGAIQDFIGYGGTSTCFETAIAPAHSATTWLTRAAGGCTDNNNNSTDFSATTTAVRNTASTINTCSVVPTVSTGSATGITTADATFNGTVTAGGATATVVFNYGTSLAYGTNVTATQSPLAGSSVGAAVSASVTGLSLNTLYHFRASATNNAGTTNGSDATFYTLAGTPNAPSVGGATASSLSVTITADGNSSGTEYAIRETGSGNYVQLNGSLSSTPVWRTASAWGAMAVTGLTASTTYSFDVKARNGDLIETAFSATGSGTTTSASSPTIIVTASVTAFSSTAGTPSSSQSYTVEGSNLTADITIAPPASFEISTDNSTWVTSVGTITLTQSGGSVAPTLIYARFNPATSGTFSGAIQHTSTGATQQDLLVSGTAIATEPTIQSAITFGATTTSSIEVNFSGGDGANRIVVASLSPVTFVPVDGSAISGVNTNFATAFDQGSGNKVIYDGSGNTVTVTGLSSSTLYYFAVYEYNGTGTLINYYVTSPGTGVKGSATAEPTISSTTAFTKTTATTAILTFISGNGANRIVVLKAGSAVSFVPADGTGYTGVNSDFSLATDQGSGDKIVYDGNATTVTVTGLVSGVTYHAAVYEYNSSGALSNYLTSTFGSASAATVASISYTTGTYTQNFDGLPITGTTSFGSFGNGANTLSTPPVSGSSLTGWQVANSTGGTPSLVADNGAGSSGAAYSYGTTGSTDRALGSLASNSFTAYYGAVLQNDGSTPLSTVSISFTNEQWKSGAASLTNHINFEYSLNGSDILTGTFSGVSALDLNTVVATAPTVQVLDGNLPANQVAVTYTFTLSGNWLPGQKLVLRWKDFNEGGNDDGLAMDNFSFSAVGPQTPLVQESLLNFSTVLTNAMTANWTPGDGTNRILVMNTTNSFTNPVDGNTYTANSVYSGSGEQVVYDGTGTSVNVTGLTPSTQYYFRAYGYNGIGVATKYNTTTATDNPLDQTTAAPSFPTQLVVLNVNSGADVIVNQPFTVTVQAQDGAGSPQNVVLNTDVTLTVFLGSGNLTATVTGTMIAGTNTLTISGVQYDFAEGFVMLDAAATSGDVLTSAQTNPFSVYDVASNLQFAGVPLNGILNTPVSPFTVFAARPDGSVDPYYSGSATIALFNGPGSVTGTLTKPFVNGVATFDDIQFSAIGVYVLDANSGVLTPAISSNILINPAPAFTELVVPKYFGAKEAASANNVRTPIAICFQIDNISPNTTYNLGFGLASLLRRLQS